MTTIRGTPIRVKILVPASWTADGYRRKTDTVIHIGQIIDVYNVNGDYRFVDKWGELCSLPSSYWRELSPLEQLAEALLEVSE